MNHTHPLYGSCSCGRNRYIVEIPASPSPSTAQVIFDERSTSARRPSTHPTPYLRVPLSWYHSATISFYPDETHASIRRTYTSPPRGSASASASASAPSDLHHFCGYCGAQLSRWTEASRAEADFISLALGTLLDVDLDDLEERGVLVFDEGTDDVDAEGARLLAHETHPSDGGRQQGALSSQGHDMPARSAVLFDPRLGRIKRQAGAHTSEDGTTRVEWEVVEWSGSDTEMADLSASASREGTTGKRKAGHLERDVQ